MHLKKRSDVHYARKIWHMSGVFIMFLGYIYLPKYTSLSLLVFAGAIFIAVDVLRHKSAVLNDWVVQMFRPIMRQSEVRSFAGTSFLFLGVLLVFLIFPPPIVALTLLFLAFADPIASYFGILYGKDKIFGHKSVQGFLAAFFVCTFLTFAYLRFNEYMMDRILLVSIFAGFIGALAEVLPVGKLDDNLTLPLLSGVGLTILFYFFGFFANLS